jgi:hypothetical protein
VLTIDDISFHESTVVELYKDTTSIHLKIQDALVNAVATPLLVSFDGVRELSIDSSLSDGIWKEHEDGEILTFARAGPGVFELVIEWNDFPHHSSVTKSYRIVCDDIRLQPSSQDAPRRGDHSPR